MATFENSPFVRQNISIGHCWGKDGSPIFLGLVF
jgi:hypothetical protein